MTVRSLYFALPMLIFVAEANAGTILQVTGPDNSSVLAASPNPFGTDQFQVASWKQGH